uniref:Transthyretin-like family protein n=1 Tax=Ascaris lumbricoides TaxID=6252 RepID=A0A0M3HPR2_ASCLU
LKDVRHIVDGTEAYEDGSFELEGENRDATTAFEPVIVVYHQCGQLKRKNSTYRRFAIKVPAVYVNANKTFDIGRINLDLFYPGQKDGIKFEHFTKPLKVSGELFCTGQPEAVRTVRMFSSLKQDSESFVAEETLDGDLFHIDSGRATLDEPILQINHQCDMSYSEITKGLYRQFVIRIPFFYYNAGRVGLREFNIGKLSLHLIYPGEVSRRLSDL